MRKVQGLDRKETGLVMHANAHSDRWKNTLLMEAVNPAYSL